MLCFTIKLGAHQFLMCYTQRVNFTTPHHSKLLVCSHVLLQNDCILLTMHIHCEHKTANDALCRFQRMFVKLVKTDKVGTRPNS